MVHQATEKIFVDPDDEISFVIERILSSAKDTVVLVIPQNSLLFGSVLSLKILFRQAAYDDKAVIIVTEDNYGINISQKAGFVVTQRVSQITSDLIEVARAKLMSYKQKLEKKKRELLGNPVVEEDPVQISKAELKDISQINNEIEEEYSQKFEEEKVIPAEVKTASKPINIKEISGIKIFGGSDIEDFDNNSKDDKIHKLDNLDMESGDRKVDTTIFKENRFAGRDFTKQIKQKRQGIFGGLFSKFGKASPETRGETVEKILPKLPWYRRKVFFIVTGVAFFVLLVAYLAVFQWSQVTLIVTLEKEEVLASLTVELSDTVKGFNERDLAIETLNLDVEESSSTTGTASGQGTRGNRATGTVYIFNKTQAQIAFPAGTTIASANSRLEFTFVDAVSLPAATLDPDQSINPSLTEGIRVQARTFGEEYNLTGSTDQSFTVDGYGINEVEIKREADFAGGTKETFVSVSAQNITELKDKAVKELQPKALARLKADVPNGFILLEDTVKYTEKEVLARPEVDQPARSDNTFDLSLVITATGTAVRERDLRAVIGYAITSEDKSEEGQSKNIDSLDSIETKDYLENAEGKFITVFAEGTVTNLITEEQLKLAVKGKSISDAQKALNEIDSVSSFEINFAPDFVPSGLKTVPNDVSRITVRFR